jgi:fructose-1-phosphate kinase PfkB-like protein
LNKGCSARPFLAKPNDVEAGKLTGLPVGSRTEIETAAQAVRASGVKNVVISLGKNGAILVDAENSWAAPSPSIQEGNPIGAGDSMVGGLVWGLSQGMAAAEALRWGLACGAATASRKGTAVGTKAQVEELVQQITVVPGGDQ